MTAFFRIFRLNKLSNTLDFCNEFKLDYTYKKYSYESRIDHIIINQISIKLIQSVEILNDPIRNPYRTKEINLLEKVQPQLLGDISVGLRDKLSGTVNKDKISLQIGLFQNGIVCQNKL